jgi:hypothetical protein
MSIPLLLGLVAAASVIIGAVAVRIGLSPRMARRAGLATLEFAGLWTVCLLLDLALGAAVILGLRSLTHSFVSIYVLNDVSLVVMSALQAFALYAWLGVSNR